MKRYDGPDGVFYDKKHDELFVLEWTGARYINIKTFKENGKSYRYWRRGHYSAKIAMTGMQYCVRIGDL